MSQIQKRSLNRRCRERGRTHLSGDVDPGGVGDGAPGGGVLVQGHPPPHARHDGQVRRRHARAHEQDDVLMADHGQAGHQRPEAALGAGVGAVEGVDHDVAVPAAPEGGGGLGAGAREGFMAKRGKVIMQQ